MYAWLHNTTHGYETERAVIALCATLRGVCVRMIEYTDRRGFTHSDTARVTCDGKAP